MAALCPGVQYGVSSQENFGENKTLVFVKLTDSAYRAIEEHLKLQKQNKHFSRTPTIKFLGNEGQFSFSSAPPSTDNTAGSNNGITPPASAATTTFNFSLSSTADMEGPGGSFECVQHRQQLPAAVGGARSGGGGTTLAVLGPIAHKMRVHATDDVYEETRKRMTVADKIQKNKCTQEIKPNQTDIGRKVKVRQHHNSQQQSSSSQSAAVNTSSSRSGNIGGGSGGSSFSRISNSIRRNDPASSSSSANVPASYMSSSSSAAAAAAAISSSSMPNSVVNSNHSPLKSGSPYSPSLNTGLYSSDNNGLLDRISGGGNMSISSMPQRPNGQQGLHSNHVSSSKPPKQSISNISKRPLRERLIHLLALRPFKKIEIHERLNKEGLREKNLIQTVLKHVSTMKDNCYYLNRVMWNDVQEEWPFYTEQEKQVLKRQKPQNLTPPGGSDGGSSTGSGNSPTSTHPGSPPSTTTTTMSSSGRHRVSHLSNLQQPGTYNHQQISHRQQQTAPQQQLLQSGMLLDNGKRQQHQQNLPPVDRRDASGMNPRSRQQEQQQHQQQGPVYGGVKRQLSEDDEETMGEDEGSRKRQCDSHILSFGVNRDPKLLTSSQSDSTTTLSLQNSRSPSKPSCPQLQQQPTKQSLSNSSAFDSTRTSISNISSQRTTISTLKQQHQEQPTDDCNSSTTWWTNNANNSKGGTSAQGPKQRKEAARVSPDSQSDRIDSMQRQQQGERSPPAETETESEKWLGPEDDDEYDYVREYTTIKDLGQRRRYKNDFNAVYDEYKKLHGVVEAVSHRFQILDEKLKRESVVNTPKYNDIKDQIMREYMLTKKDQQHQRNKRRFEYLHRKLSHIKDLVSQFDQHIQRDETMAPAPQYTTSAAATSTY